MNAPEASKPAPVKMVNFIGELLLDLSSPGKVVSVEVGDAAYLVTVALPDGALTVHQLSAWDVSRSLRGDPRAREAVREGLARGSASGSPC